MMNNDPSAVKRGAEYRKQQGQKFWKWLTYQWGWKLTSLVLAVCLWGGLISQDTSLPRSKTFQNVKISVTNASLLQQSGFIVVAGLDELAPVEIDVQVPQRAYSTVTASNYTVRADLSQIKAAGEQTIKLTASATNSSLYGTVTDISLDSITVQVEEYATRTRIPVQLNATGEAPAGFYADTAACDPQFVDIGGPRSLVQSIVRCVAQYDMSMLEPIQGTARNSVSFIFQDRAGNEISADKLTVTSQSVRLRNIVVDQPLYPTMEVPISKANLTVGQPPEGYEVTEISLYPETVRIAASDLSPYVGEDVYFYLVSRVNITGETQDVTRAMTISRPGGIINMSSDVAYVTVSIRPIEEEAEQGE